MFLFAYNIRDSLAIFKINAQFSLTKQESVDEDMEL